LKNKKSAWGGKNNPGPFLKEFDGETDESGNIIQEKVV
jgi:hypothetical protein